jgi:predicted nucleotidyltransferase
MSSFDTYWRDFLKEQTEPAQVSFRKQRKRNDIYTTQGGLEDKNSGSPYNIDVRRFGTDPLRFEEEIDPDSIDLSSFSVHEELDGKLWDKEGNLDSSVRDRLYQIAKRFYESLGIKAEIKDITLTGSLANYNWSKYSDLDVHIVVDYNEIDENNDLVRDLFQQSKTNWNLQHNIKVRGYDVELYVQDDNEPHHSSGVYSLLKDEWLVKPAREKPEIDKEAIRKKAASIMDMADEAQRLFDDGNYAEAGSYAKRTMDKLKKARAAGLEREGEYSFENLAFKVLRRNDYLEKLSKLRIDAYDSDMSLTQE